MDDWLNIALDFERLIVLDLYRYWGTATVKDYEEFYFNIPLDFYGDYRAIRCIYKKAVFCKKSEFWNRNLCTYSTLVLPWIGHSIFTRRLITSQLVKKFPNDTRIKPRNLLPCLEELPLDPILCHVNVAHIVTPYLTPILLQTSRSVPTGFQTKTLNIFLIPSMPATYLVHSTTLI
jgi:hypothetical protein